MRCALLVHFVGAVARLGHAVTNTADRAWQARAAEGAAIRVGQHADRHVADADRIRAEHIAAARIGLQQFGVELMVLRCLERRAPQEADARGLRIDLRVVHVVIAATQRAARAIRRVHGRWRIAAGRAGIDAPRGRARRNQPGRGQSVALRGGHIDVGRIGAGRHQRRQQRGERTFLDELALAGLQGVKLLQVDHAEQVEAILVETADTAAERGRALARATFLRGRGIHAEVGALVVAARDEVDDAADSVRAVDGGGAVLEHLDALQSSGRDVVQVDACAVAGRCEISQAPAVEQHQRARHTDAAQVCTIEAALARSAVGDRRAVGQGRRVGADGLEQFGGRRGAALVDVFAADRLHRKCRFASESLDAGARHLHALRCRFGSLLRAGRKRRRTAPASPG